MPITGKKVVQPAKEFDKYWVLEQGSRAELGEAPKGYATFIPYREVDGVKEAAPRELWISLFVEDVYAMAQQPETVGIALAKTLEAWELIAKEQNKI